MTRRLCAVAWLLSAVAAFAEPAVRRVVSTVPACTEMLFAIGAGDQVVAVTDYCRYPAEAARREKVGGYSDLSFEKLLSLRPDLVVIADYAHRLRAQCASARLSVLELKTGSISEILAAIETLGRATGHEQRARAVVESIRADLEKTRAINAGKPPRRALLVIGRPLGSFQQLLGAGPGSFLSELLALAGGDNVLDDARQAWPQINLEAVLARKPEVIIELIGEAMPAGLAPEQTTRRKSDWARFTSIPAVANGRIHLLISDHALIPGPRVTDTARVLADLLR